MRIDDTICRNNLPDNVKVSLNYLMSTNPS